MKTLVIGVGNEFRGDDGVGRQVVRELRKRQPANVSILESSGESFSLIEMWTGVEKVILVDALQSGAEPGTIRRFDLGDQAMPAEVLGQCSTHGSSVPEAIELARYLHRLPPEVILYGIEALHFEHGCSLSSFARSAVAVALDRILTEILEEKQASNVPESKAVRLDPTESLGNEGSSSESVE